MRPGLVFIFLLVTGFASIASASPDQKAAFVGQWVWSLQDQKVFTESQKQIPDLAPALWVSTLSYRQGKIEQRLALSPHLLKMNSLALVIRLDDSLHQAWDELSAKELAGQIDEKLKVLLALLSQADVQIREIQLDYDCPVRRLTAWSATLQKLSEGSLHGQNLWITSLVAHQQNADFGKLFRGKIQGHILQVFDTGDALSQNALEEITLRLSQQGIPFRLGLGAFERSDPAGAATENREWFATVPEISRNLFFRGLWIFPGGKTWTYLLSKI